MQTNLDTVLARIDALECQNRRLRLSGLAVTLLAVGVFALGAIWTAAPGSSGVPGVLQAHDFQLLDSHGGRLAELGVIDGTPMLALYDSATKLEPTVLLEGSGVLDLQKGDGEVSVSVGNGLSGMSIRGSESFLDMNQAADKSVYLLSDKNGASLSFGGGIYGISPVELRFDGEPTLQLVDSAGFETDIGVANTISTTTGEQRKTSAASIVMFGNDKQHHVIWEAPIH